MGLDMNLYERTFCPVAWTDKGKKKTKLTAYIYDWEGRPFKQKFDNVAYISCRKGYWRKAYAIHRYFIDHCDHDCYDTSGEFVVDDDILKKLLFECESLVKMRGKRFTLNAKRLLPTFDDDDITDWKYYRECLKRTIKIIKSLDLDSPRTEYVYSFCY